MENIHQAEASVDQTGKSAEKRRVMVMFAVVGLYALAIYLPFLGSGRSLTSHEVMVAHPAMEMLRQGQWLVPMYAGEPWVRKPPLVVWVTAGFMKTAGGFDEFVVRLPAALSAVGLCLLVALLTWRFVNTRAALFAGMVQATCVYAYTQGRLGEIDMPLALLVGAASAVLLWHWGEGGTALPLSAAALFHLLCGLVLLAKGPVGVAIIGATIIGFCAIRRSIRPLVSVTRTPALVLFFLVGFPWYVAVYRQLGHSVLEGWLYENVARASGEHTQGSDPWNLYLWSVPFYSMLPWTIALIFGGPFLYRRTRREAAWMERFLWVWFAAGLILLSFSAHKHHHYAVPLLAPLSVLCGMVLDEHVRVSGHRALRFYAGTFAAALVALAIVGGFVIPRHDDRRAAAAFLEQQTSTIPSTDRLYVAELEQSAAYAYIRRDCRYLADVVELGPAMSRQESGVAWLLTYRQAAGDLMYEGLSFEEVAAEPAEEKTLTGRSLVLGRVRMLDRPVARPEKGMTIGELMSTSRPSDE